MEENIIFQGKWKDKAHKAAMRRFRKEHFLSRIAGVAIWILVYLGFAAIVLSIIPNDSEAFLPSLLSFCAALVVILCILAFLFLYHSKVIGAKEGDDYSVAVIGDEARPVLLLRSGKQERRMAIGRIFLTSDFIYIGRGAHDYVVLPPDRQASDFLLERCFDKLSVEYRTGFGYFGGRPNR